jgi:hypothetical protein
LTVLCFETGGFIKMMKFFSLLVLAAISILLLNGCMTATGEIKIDPNTGEVVEEKK